MFTLDKNKICIEYDRVKESIVFQKSKCFTGKENRIISHRSWLIYSNKETKQTFVIYTMHVVKKWQECRMFDKIFELCTE